jgi:TrmH family RNA methyltransferase
VDFLTPTKSQIADWARLGQKRARRERGLFLIEGEVCTREALKAKARLEALLVLGTEAERWEEVLESAKRVPLYRLNTDAFRRISKVETSQGIVAVGKMFSLPPRKTNLAMAVEQVSDPGNCGALIRVADFFGVSELYLGPGSADVWNEKVVRGSMGSIFHQPVRADAELTDIIRDWKGTSVAAVSHGGQKLDIRRSQFDAPTLLVLGHETRGLSPEIGELCSHQATLQPLGDAESLNLVTAAAVFAHTLLVSTRDRS